MQAGYETILYTELAYSKPFNGDWECCREEQDLPVSWEERDQLVQCMLVVHGQQFVSLRRKDQGEEEGRRRIQRGRENEDGHVQKKKGQELSDLAINIKLYMYFVIVLYTLL